MMESAESKRTDDAGVSASKLIVLEERRYCQTSTTLFVIVNRTLFLLLNVVIIASQRAFGVPGGYFLALAVVLGAVWFGEVALIRSRLRSIGELVIQLESHIPGQSTPGGSWSDALVKLSYLSNYGSSPISLARWRLAEPIVWLVLAVVLSVFVKVT